MSPTKNELPQFWKIFAQNSSDALQLEFISLVQSASESNPEMCDHDEDEAPEWRRVAKAISQTLMEKELR
ncbi:hypothetical protein Pmar_PMAR010012 [Perkinsus marinus ATCC 50983]|uniref:Uncharacterized protein n=1 Tax=Perkinsus marinus (strain ATCC 50983 / TXsc) TaxID=423536 RepID=C5K5I9_PERM5|nr:hypothetical protein Pmar_PMAR010012 [Perkinsus marinus ATCC 50983]EER20251.1 hypothetical protein Pmar_PMAR010012 [Perkinsus marinus ATCC 50983]|eukprot:XP_002788455.1 hypothetical protein Pmar_PMAR010012 [Perkinsus marinus ATCC 50983]